MKKPRDTYLKTAQFFLLILCAMIFLSAPLRADMIGSTLSWQYYAYGGVYTSGTNSGTFVVNGGVGGTFSVGGTVFFNIVADGNSITFDYSVNNAISPWSSSGLSLAPTIYNGIAINLVSGSPFTSVTIDPLTNMVGFDASRFSFTGSQIQVDWVNLAFDQNTKVKLDVNAGGTSTVPEPASLLLLGTGFGVLGLAAWRRRK